MTNKYKGKQVFQYNMPDDILSRRSHFMFKALQFSFLITSFIPPSDVFLSTWLIDARDMPDYSAHSRNTSIQEKEADTNSVLMTYKISIFSRSRCHERIVQQNILLGIFDQISYVRGVPSVSWHDLFGEKTRSGILNAIFERHQFAWPLCRPAKIWTTIIKSVTQLANLMEPIASLERMPHIIGLWRVLPSYWWVMPYSGSPKSVLPSGSLSQTLTSGYISNYT